MDARVRAAERRWRSSPDDLEALEALRVECARAGGDLPDDAVRALPRWQRLQGFARKWRDRPLGPRDGLPLAKVLAREKQLGFRLPAALREWYRLVGGTLHEVQDTPIKLGTLGLNGGVLEFFIENQGAYRWGILGTHLDEDDPPVHGAYVDQPFDGVADRLSDLLLAKVLYEATLAAEGRCTIGRLRRGVRTGFSDTLDAGVRRRLFRLPVVATGYPPDSAIHGDADTILLLFEEEGWGYSAARTPEAWAVLEGLGFRPSGT